MFYFFFLTGRVLRRFFFFFRAEDGIRDRNVTGVQTCALPISGRCGLSCAVALRTDNQSRRLPRRLSAIRQVFRRESTASLWSSSILKMFCSVGKSPLRTSPVYFSSDCLIMVDTSA